MAEALARRPFITVIVPSGSILKSSKSIVGAQVLALLKSIRADVCFLGACSIGLEFGIGAIEADELPIKQQMIESSAKVIALASNEKFNARPAYSVCPLSVLDTIVTDQKTPRSLLERYQGLGIPTLAS